MFRSFQTKPSTLTPERRISSILEPRKWVTAIGYSLTISLLFILGDALMRMPPRRSGDSNPEFPKPSNAKVKPKRKRSKKSNNRLVMFYGGGGLTAAAGIIVAFINGCFSVPNNNAEQKPQNNNSSTSTVTNSHVSGTLVQNSGSNVHIFVDDPRKEQAFKVLESKAERLEGNRGNLKQGILDLVSEERTIANRLANGEINQNEASRLREEAEGRLIDVARHNQKLFSGTDLIEVKDAITTLASPGVGRLNLELFTNKNTEYDNILARCYAIKKSSEPDRLAKAVREADLAIGMEPRDPRAFQVRGWCNLELGKLDEAIADFKQVVSFPMPVLESEQRENGLYDKVDAYVGLSTALCRKSEAIDDKSLLSPAISSLDQALKLAPEDSRSYHHRALANALADHHDRAIDDFSQAIRLAAGSPSLWESYLWRGASYFKKKDYKQAIEDLSKAIDLNEIAVNAYVWRSMVLEEVGQHAKAEMDRKTADQIKQGNRN